ncbi:MAG: hypothetical protein GWN14_06090 [candidate division Zixibacteria bacterium]|nr:hypothetical protein [candidate division Zixibacteria bacterium]
MKENYILASTITIVIIVGLVIPQLIPSENLIRNGGFEADLEGWAVRGEQLVSIVDGYSGKGCKFSGGGSIDQPGVEVPSGMIYFSYKYQIISGDWRIGFWADAGDKIGYFIRGSPDEPAYSFNPNEITTVTKKRLGDWVYVVGKFYLYSPRPMHIQVRSGQSGGNEVILFDDLYLGTVKP